MTTTNPEDDEEEKWLVLYLEGEAVIQKKSMLKVSGDNNLMIIVEDGIKIAGTISVSSNNKIRVYVMEGLNDKKKEDDPDVEIFMSGLIGIEYHPELLTFYLNPFSSTPLVATIDTNPEFYGYIIGPESFINMKNGQTKVYGGIYGRNVKLESEIFFEQKKPSNQNVTLYKQMGIAYWE
jgi:hypothetical protein